MAHILVVDDHLHIREMLRGVLERYGYEVTMASNGKEALARHRETPADLIITDLLMPEKEGIETIRELRCDNPEVKIIAMSGGGSVGPKEYLRMAQMFGAQRTFEKPFNVYEMLDAIKECLGAAPPNPGKG